jgi:hypothetical protein
MECLFWPYRSLLYFEAEHILSRQPIKMDLLILKKEEAAELPLDIARIFRKHNVIEYKNPKDGLSIDVFYKTVAYTCLYKSEGQTTNEIPAEELTLSIFRFSYPRKLFQVLSDLGANVKNKYAGVYYVTGIVHFPVQIVVIKELEPEIYSFLRVLAPNAKEEDIRQFIQQAGSSQDSGYRRNADAVMQVSIALNRAKYDEIRKGDRFMCEALRELMWEEYEEDKAKFRKEAREEGLAEGRTEGLAEGRTEGLAEGRKQERLSAIKSLMDTMKLTAQQAMDALKIPLSEQKNYQGML